MTLLKKQKTEAVAAENRARGLNYLIK